MFNLYINERRIGDVIALDLKGRLRITGRATGLHTSIRCLVGEGKTRILLNLSQVTHIDASGLDELLASCVTVSNEGGEIKLLHVTDQIREVITTANLSAVLDIYNNEYDAIASFKREVALPENYLAEAFEFISAIPGLRQSSGEISQRLQR